MIKSSDEMVGEFRVQTTQFPAMKAFELFGRLLRALGPAIASLSTLNKDMDLRDALPQLAAGLKAVEPVELSSLLEQLFKNTRVIITDDKGRERGKDLTSRGEIDAVFTGKLMGMLEVAAHVIKVNFADFFAGSGPLDGAAPTPSAG